MYVGKLKRMTHLFIHLCSLEVRLVIILVQFDGLGKVDNRHCAVSSFLEDHGAMTQMHKRIIHISQMIVHSSKDGISCFLLHAVSRTKGKW